MKAAVVLLTLVLLVTACSNSKSATVEKTATEVPTATVIAVSTEIATPTATECPEVSADEATLREVLKKGDLLGKTVRLFLVGSCEIHQAISYKKANKFATENPSVSDYRQFPAEIDPIKELTSWEVDNHLPTGTLTHGIHMVRDLYVAPSEAVCQILKPEGLQCTD